MEMVLYQTLEDRYNYDEVEQKGPFTGERKSSWLGIGFYFWDTHIELAHWWGSHAYNKKDKEYMICKAFAVLNKDCWDLIGNGGHRMEFDLVCSQFVKEFPKEKFWFLKLLCTLYKNGGMKYRAIRALPINTIKVLSKYTKRILFVEWNEAYYDSFPPIQICLFDKKALNLRNYHVIFPDEACENLY
ncbi:MAG: hypothetical protein IPH46_04990 [Bacteroidetes bacterium]|nr:hypothetical protein [Bacteroidota bacterium]